jgi:hypothetical protein
MKVIWTITGVDGSGKTTFLEKIRLNASKFNQGRILALRVPQYHESILPNNSDVKYKKEAQILEAIGQLGDKLKNPLIKVNASYLAFSLFGPIIKDLSEKFPDHMLITERYPIIDIITYSKFYGRYLQMPFTKEQMKETLDKEFSPEDLALINKLIQELPMPNKFNIYNFHEYIKLSFAKSEEDFLQILIKDMQLESQVTETNFFTLLKLTPELMESRMILKRSHNEIKEAHETVETLKLLQKAKESIAVGLSKSLSTFHFNVFEIKDESVDDGFQRLSTFLISSCK